jgi:hypothetical protein
MFAAFTADSILLSSCGLNIELIAQLFSLEDSNICTSFLWLYAAFGCKNGFCLQKVFFVLQANAA